MLLQWQQRIRFQNLTDTRWDKSQVSGKNFYRCRDIYQKPSMRVKTKVKTNSGPHRVKADHNKLHFSITEMQDSFSWSQEVFD